MELIRPLQEAAGPGQALHMLATFGVAVLFAAIYLFGGRASQVFRERGRRRFLSFAAGLSVSYTFVHILPELHEIRQLHLQPQADYFQRFFPEYSVYLGALVGFLVFYGLESMATRKHHGPENRATLWQSWLNIGGFVLYTWLITYLMVRPAKGLLALGLFAVAMGMHIAPIANKLRSEHRSAYEHRGAIVLALACLAGWGCGLTLNIPERIVMDMVAIVAGGVIVNSAIAELPKERGSSFWSFFFGATAYTALLLTLSHFEKGA